MLPIWQATWRRQGVFGPIEFGPSRDIHLSKDPLALEIFEYVAVELLTEFGHDHRAPHIVMHIVEGLAIFQFAGICHVIGANPESVTLSLADPHLIPRAKEAVKAILLSSNRYSAYCGGRGSVSADSTFTEDVV